MSLRYLRRCLLAPIRKTLAHIYATQGIASSAVRSLSFGYRSYSDKKDEKKTCTNPEPKKKPKPKKKGECMSYKPDPCSPGEEPKRKDASVASPADKITRKREFIKTKGNKGKSPCGKEKKDKDKDPCAKWKKQKAEAEAKRKALKKELEDACKKKKDC